MKKIVRQSRGESKRKETRAREKGVVTYQTDSRRWRAKQLQFLDETFRNRKLSENFLEIGLFRCATSKFIERDARPLCKFSRKSMEEMMPEIETPSFSFHLKSGDAKSDATCSSTGFRHFFCMFVRKLPLSLSLSFSLSFCLFPFSSQFSLSLSLGLSCGKGPLPSLLF